MTNRNDDRPQVVISVQVGKDIDLAEYLARYSKELAAQTGRAGVCHGFRRPK